MRPGSDGNGAIVNFNILNAFETATVIPEEVLQQFLKERLKFKQEQAHMIELMKRNGVKSLG